MIKLNIDWLKANHISLEFFGLGFLQLKLNKNNRLHFYTKELPSIIGEEDVHNHRYDFTSFVLKGNLTQEIFDVVEGKTFTKEQESCKVGVECSSEGSLCDIKLVSSHTYSAGSKYFISHDVFHKVKSDECITFINRSEYKKELADVIRPVGQNKICPFSKKVDQDVLWAIVENMIQGVNLCQVLQTFS